MLRNLLAGLLASTALAASAANANNANRVDLPVFDLVNDTRTQGYVEIDSTQALELYSKSGELIEKLEFLFSDNTIPAQNLITYFYAGRKYSVIVAINPVTGENLSYATTRAAKARPAPDPNFVVPPLTKQQKIDNITAAIAAYREAGKFDAADRLAKKLEQVKNLPDDQ
ncbi:MAG: hypothetical protein KME03_19700 [Aphanocapsa lilacina HA4352-LM1]|nr:hypothetical protein [Aphanocapsa lilacina HA4352-LM1]